jgi:hypothetical protein
MHATTRNKSAGAICAHVESKPASPNLPAPQRRMPALAKRAWTGRRSGFRTGCPSGWCRENETAAPCFIALALSIALEKARGRGHRPDRRYRTPHGHFCCATPVGGRIAGGVIHRLARQTDGEDAAPVVCAGHRSRIGGQIHPPGRQELRVQGQAPITVDAGRSAAAV